MIEFTLHPARALNEAIERFKPGALFYVIPQGIAQIPIVEQIARNGVKIFIDDAPQHKQIETADYIWQTLLDNGATRKSLIVNIGGGTTSDIGGFAAACYMRGIDYINIPTTLLAAVDASIGGKTGVNLGNVKNIIGAFHHPLHTIISPVFFDTLPPEQLLSGYGEIIKHALLTPDENLSAILHRDIFATAPQEWIEIVRHSIAVKQRIVESDPSEKGLRKALNLGHTTAHAFEALAATRGTTLQHGHAVALGLIVALILSHTRLGFPSDILREISTRIKELYRPFPITCTDYDSLLHFMRHDKKNAAASDICFTLLSEPGVPVVDCTTDDDSIKNAFDIYRDITGC